MIKLSSEDLTKEADNSAHCGSIGGLCGSLGVIECRWETFGDVFGSLGVVVAHWGSLGLIDDVGGHMGGRCGSLGVVVGRWEIFGAC